MGGEPTFVSIDDMDGAEWTIGRRRRGEARAGARPHAAPRASGSPPAARSSTGRASGTRASRCPAGNSASTGVTTATAVAPARPARRSVRKPGSRPSRRRGSSPRASPPRFGLDPAASSPPTRIRSTRRWREARLPSGDPPTPTSTDDDDVDEPDARVAPARRLVDRAPNPSGSSCRCTRHSTGPRWVTTTWTFGGTGCSSSPATRRSASACRSTR